MGNQCTPGRLRGPCGSSQHAGLGRSTCPLRSGSRFLLGCFALLFVLLFFFSPATFEGLFLCVYFCLPVQLSLGPFSVPKLGQESFKVMASSSLGWRSGSQVSDPRTAAFAGVEAAGRPRKHTFPERARAFARRKLILKLSVLFRYGPTQDKVASGRSDPGPGGKKAPCHFD